VQLAYFCIVVVLVAILLLVATVPIVNFHIVSVEVPAELDKQLGKNAAGTAVTPPPPIRASAVPSDSETPSTHASPGTSQAVDLIEEQDRTAVGGKHRHPPRVNKQRADSALRLSHVF
jgi:hypothetical protein